MLTRLVLAIVAVASVACVTSAATAGPGTVAAASAKSKKLCRAVAAPRKHASSRRVRQLVKRRKGRAVKRRGRRVPCSRLRAPRQHPSPAPAPATPAPDAPLPEVPAESGPVSPPQEQQGHSVQVRAREYSLAMSRTTVAAGDVNVEFNTVNAEDPHDLWLRDSAGTGRPLFGETAPELLPPPRQPFAVAAGEYVLFCSVAGHEALGMSAQLSVK